MLVDEWGQHLGLREVRQILLNPHVTPAVIEALACNRRLMGIYEVKAAVAGHPRTPEHLAMRLLPQIRWRQLMGISRDTRIRAPVRRVAEKYLGQRLPRLTVGEKVSLARLATPEVAAVLAHDPSQKVLRAVLENPRLSEAALLPMLTSHRATPHHLERVARHERWGPRYDVRVALCRNPKTPFRVIFELLPSLRAAELAIVAGCEEHAQIVKSRAEDLLAASGSEDGENAVIEIESGDHRDEMPFRFASTPVEEIGVSMLWAPDDE